MHGCTIGPWESSASLGRAAVRGPLVRDFGWRLHNMAGSTWTETTIGMAEAMEVRALGLDDFSSIRYIHVGALRIGGATLYNPEEIEAFAAFVQTPGYVDVLRQESLAGGFLGNELVATSSWLPGDDSGTVARIASVFVRPMFTGLGFGRRLVGEAEAQARRSGFHSFSARVLLNAVGFFEALGYKVISHGVQPFTDETSLPIAFMRKSA